MQQQQQVVNTSCERRCLATSGCGIGIWYFCSSLRVPHSCQQLPFTDAFIDLRSKDGEVVLISPGDGCLFTVHDMP